MVEHPANAYSFGGTNMIPSQKELYSQTQDKVCTLCGLSLPINLFYKNKGCSGGRIKQCVICVSNNRKDKRKADRLARQLPIPDSKICLSPTCILAGILQPFTGFNKSKHGRYGLHPWCRECCQKRGHQYVISLALRRNSSKFPQFKTCSKDTCIHGGILQPLDNFSKSSFTLDGRDPRCKTCVLEYGRKWKKNNSERVEENRKRRDKEHPELKKEWLRKKLIENPDYRKIIHANFYIRHKKEIASEFKEKRMNNPDVKAWDRTNRLRSRGANLEWYDKTLAAQSGVCAICGSTDSGYPTGRFAVDHDHNCCKPGRSCDKCRRGLLCNRCNTWIERFEKYPNIAKRAISYLNRHALNKTEEIEQFQLFTH